jgi:aspartyl aminopeptidase
MSSNISLNTGLCDFLRQSPTPFHAVKNISESLQAAGFQALSEGDVWQLEADNAYYVTRNASSVIAFRTGSGNPVEQGFHMIGTHTDSPCLKVKPEAGFVSAGYAQLGVEVYGGVLMNPWFDRDLSLAGRVNYEDSAGLIKAVLIDFQKAIATIPSLAIHLDREANKSRSINEQKHLPPVLMQLNDKQKHFNFSDFLLFYLQDELGLSDVEQVLGFELSLYDTQAPALIGLKGEFLASARLDNLLSCYVGLQALLDAEGELPSLLVCTDNEEVGSISLAGAAGSFLEAVLERIAESFSLDKKQEAKRRMLEHSMLLSVDNAHGIHPNFMDRHDQQHGPILNQGPVLKVNANQRYATTSESSARFKSYCKKAEVPLQSFVVRTDMACGSTIGPIVAAELGIKTLDVGVPTFGMHSIRELAGNQDIRYLLSALQAYLSR